MKTLTYGLMHVCVATAVAYALSGSLAIALGIGLLEPFVQTIFFYMHERVWERKISAGDSSGEMQSALVRVNR